MGKHNARARIKQVETAAYSQVVTEMAATVLEPIPELRLGVAGMGDASTPISTGCDISHSHYIPQLGNSGVAGHGAQTLSFRIESGMDAIDRMYVETTWPGLPPQAAAGHGLGLVHYVWGLGFACWQWLEVRNGQHWVVPRTPSDAMEAALELRMPAGHALREMVFKWDDVSSHNLGALSSRPFTCFCPVDVWFTRPGNRLLTHNLNYSLTLRLRDLRQVVAVHRAADGALEDPGSRPDLALPSVRDSETGALRPLSWRDVRVRVLVRGVKEHGRSGPELEMVTVGHVTTGVYESKTDRVGGVRVPWGSTAVEVPLGSLPMDPVRSFTVAVQEQSVARRAVSAAQTTAKYDANTGRGALLSGNRFDYRLVGDGHPEPLASLQLRYPRGDLRVRGDLPGAVHRLAALWTDSTVQTLPRMGVYHVNLVGEGFDGEDSRDAAVWQDLASVKLMLRVGGASAAGEDKVVRVWCECLAYFKQTLSEGCVRLVQ